MKKILEEKDKPPTSQIVNHFFVLKGWNDKEKAFYIENEIHYGRYVGPAKQLLTLYDGNIELAKEKLDKTAKWADDNGFDGWLIETAIKRFLNKNE